MPLDSTAANPSRNVLGGRLQTCSLDPRTGFTRSGCCETGPQDRGSHTVCAVMTAEFLAYSRSVGNDLSTPVPQYDFPGLKPGDQWCLCAPRWAEALVAGCPPQSHPRRHPRRRPRMVPTRRPESPHLTAPSPACRRGPG